MEVQLIRNATLKVHFGGKVFLIDPFFAEQYAQPSFSGNSLNPIIGLPMPVDEILKSVDYVLISHLHPDHFDDSAKSLIPKNIPVFCQPGDSESIIQAGFQEVTEINNTVTVSGINIHRTAGMHGTGKIETIMGVVSGFVLKHKQEKTLYFTGDTIWCEPVKKAISDHRPQVIICHAGGNRFFKEHPIFGEAFSGDSEAVIMDAEQVIALAMHSTNSKIIATHLGALDHETITREQLREMTLQEGILPDQLFIPYDGESINF
jgi:L-ascorbate metabolism protein UlaG (beta-lactamase superfamily)